MSNIDARKRSRLSKFLTLILRHKPELLDLSLDNDGWLPVGLEELAARIADAADGLDWVQASDIEQVVESDPKGRYEIRDDRIRATYGHSVRLNQLASPDHADDLPAILYYGGSQDELQSILRLGLVPRRERDRQYLHLSVNKNDALAVARHHHRQPRLVKVFVHLAATGGVRFRQVSPLIVITDEVPPQFLEEIPLPPHLRESGPRREGRSRDRPTRPAPGRRDRGESSDRSRDRRPSPPPRGQPTRTRHDDDDNDDDEDELIVRARRRSTIHFDIDDDMD